MTGPTRDPEVEAFLAVSAARLAPRTVEAYRRDLTALTDFLGHKPSQATPEELERYVAELRARGLAATTIARRIAAVRSFFRHQVLIGAQEENPAADVGLPRRARRLPRTLSPGEAERLVEAANGTTPRDLRDRALVELLYGAGLRVSEAVGLERNGVDLEERLVRSIGKGGKERIVPLGRSAADALRRYLSRGRPFLDKRHRPELFLNAKGGPLTRAGAFLILRRLAEKAGLEPTTDPPAPAPSLVRDAPARGRRRPTERPGDARPRRPRHDRALHARDRPQAPRGVLLRSPAREEKAQGFRRRADGNT